MARVSLEQQLSSLAALADAPLTPMAVEQLRRALAGRSNHVAAKAAEVAASLNARELEPDLVAAFDRFMQKPESIDKGCAAKSRIAEAAIRLELDAPAVESLFRRAIAHRQLEPVFGGRADTAVDLRGHAAMGLVRLNVPDVMEELADLLADPEVQARAAAARAVGYSERHDGLPLLRFRLRLGDEPEVVGECCAAVLRISGDAGLPLVGAQLEGSPAVAEAAALALGQSRLPAAMDLLVAAADRTIDGDSRQVFMLALAMLRSEPATQWLLDQVAGAGLAIAQAAIKALAIYHYDQALREKVLRAAGLNPLLTPRQVEGLLDHSA